MIEIGEYLEKPLSERRAHLRLDDSCIERGARTAYLKGLLAHILDTTVPHGHKAYVCHACYNQACNHPLHIYWGTPRENAMDTKICGRGGNVWQRVVNKYGFDEAKRMWSRPQSVEKRCRISVTLERLHREGVYKRGALAETV